MNNISSNKQIAKNTVFLYTRMVFVLLVSLYTTRAVINALGVEDYGLYNIVGGFVFMFGFMSTSLTQGIQRFYNYERGQNGDTAVNRVFNTSLISQIFLFVILLLVIETIGFYWFKYKLVIPEERYDVAWIIFQFSIISLLVGVLVTPYSALVIAYEKMNYYAFVGVVDTVLKLLIAIIIQYIDADKLLFYGGLIMIISILNFVLYSTYVHIKFKFIKINLHLDRSLFYSIITFSGWNLLGTITSMVKSHGVNILLNSFFGVIVNAANGIAGQISTAIQQFLMNIVIAFKPQLVLAYSQGNNVRVEKMMFIMSKIGFVLTYMLAVPVILEIDYILNIWIGNEIPQYTVIFTKLTIVTMVISCFNTPVTQVIHATGNIKNYHIITSIITFLILPISWIFLRLGYDAKIVFIVTLIMTVLNQLFSLIILYSEFRYNYLYYIRQIIIPCIVIAFTVPIFPFIVVTIAKTSFVRLVIVCVLSILSMIIFSYILLFDKSERTLIKDITFNKFKLNHK